ncbi:hypothetical protein ABZX51_007737 [Aspergillus tubingensis]
MPRVLGRHRSALHLHPSLSSFPFPPSPYRSTDSPRSGRRRYPFLSCLSERASILDHPLFPLPLLFPLLFLSRFCVLSRQLVLRILACPPDTYHLFRVPLSSPIFLLSCVSLKGQLPQEKQEHLVSHLAVWRKG